MGGIEMEPIIEGITIGKDAESVINNRDPVVITNPLPSSLTIDSLSLEYSLPSRKIPDIGNKSL
jgi:hypothetical protein